MAALVSPATSHLRDIDHPRNVLRVYKSRVVRRVLPKGCILRFQTIQRFPYRWVIGAGVEALVPGATARIPSRASEAQKAGSRAVLFWVMQ